MGNSASLTNYQNKQLLNKLEKLKKGRYSNRKRGQWYTAICPAHDDRSASLSVFVPDDESQHIGFNCHAGCTHADVMAALGNPARPKRVVKKSTKKRSGKRGNGRLGKLVNSYTYTDENGRKRFRKNRYEPKDFRIQHLRGRRWRWGLGDCEPVLYNLPNVIAAEQVLIVEGEKDADTLNALGFVATCNYDGASKDATFKPKWRPELYNGRLANKQIVIFPDNDEAGRVHANFIAKSLQRVATSIKVVDLDGLEQGGDVSDWLAAGNSPLTLLELVENAPTYTPLTNIYGSSANTTILHVDPGRYLSDVIEWEKLPSKISLHAGCGVGKSTAVIQTMPGKKLVLFSLVTALEQMAKQLNETTAVGVAYQECKDVDGQNIILATYDSLPYVLNRIDASQYGLVMDESHNIATSGDPGFRGKALNRVLDVMGGAWQRVVLMTGTPFPSTHPAIANLHHVNVASVIREQPAQLVRFGKLEINGRFFSVTRRDAIVGKVAANPDDTHIILLNDKRGGREKLIAGLRAAGIDAAAIATLDADDKAGKVYQQLVQNGRLPNGVRVLIATTVVAESANLYSDIDHIHIAATAKISPLVMQQFVSRPRKRAAKMVYVYTSGQGNGRGWELAKSQQLTLDDAQQCLRVAQRARLLQLDDDSPEAAQARRDWRRWDADSRRYLLVDENPETGEKFYGLNHAGIDSQVLADYSRYCHRNPAALKAELSRYGWVFANDAAAAALTPAAREIGGLLAEQMKRERLQAWGQNINIAVSYGYLRVVENVAKNLISGVEYQAAVDLLDTVHTMAGEKERHNTLLMNELLKTAAAAVKSSDGSRRKLARIQRQLKIQLDDNDRFVRAMRREFAADLAHQTKLTSNQLQARIQGVMASLPGFEFAAGETAVAYWSDEITPRLTENRAVRIVGDIFGLKRCKIATEEGRINGYQLMSDNPITELTEAMTAARQSVSLRAEGLTAVLPLNETVVQPTVVFESFSQQRSRRKDVYAVNVAELVETIPF